MNTILITTTWLSIILAGFCLWGSWVALKGWREAIDIAKDSLETAKSAIALYEDLKREYDTFVEAHRLITQDKAE